MPYSLKDRQQRQQKATDVFLRRLEKEHCQSGWSYKGWKTRKAKFLTGREA
jgi:hypothetical protein